MKTVEPVPIRVQPNPHNERYLKAKRERWGTFCNLRFLIDDLRGDVFLPQRRRRGIFVVSNPTQTQAP
jgi:hypothetical protein